MSQKHLKDDLIQEFLDGTLKDQSKFESHISSCSKCRADLNSYQEIYGGLGIDKTPDLSIDFENRLMDKIATLPIPQIAQQKEERGRVFDFVMGFAAAVASIILLVYYNGLQAFVNTYKVFNKMESNASQAIKSQGDILYDKFGISFETALFIAFVLIFFGLLDRFLLRKKVKGLKVFSI